MSEPNIYENCSYCRGFLFSREKGVELKGVTDSWNKTEINVGGELFVHPKLNCFENVTETTAYYLIGHAYDPFNMISDENALLEKVAIKGGDIDEILCEINKWTGLFTLLIFSDKDTFIVGDCCCMQAAYYGIVDDNLLICSHAQMVGDIYKIEPSGYVKKMTKYRFWQKYGLFLPGDCSQFDSVKRVVPNTYVCIKGGEIFVKRFFPVKENEEVKTEEEYNETINKIAALMHNNLELITEKWKAPAISMTGGMDSKTTVACANGLYDKFRYYSYVSMAGDKIDAEAASRIAESIGVTHNTYVISESDSDFPQADNIRKAIIRNYGYIGKPNENDVRKRAFFYDTKEFDVEVKSWVSEIGRANYYKKFGLKKMPKRLRPRDMTTMYKFFSYNRLSALKTDKIFKKYIVKTQFDDLYNYDPSDMYLWEFRYGAWGGLVITSEHRVSYDITIPYNNRLIMKEFLKLPLEKRIKDIPHYDIIKLMNRKIDETGITIVNWNETEKRKKLERLYWFVNRHII